MLVRNGEGPYLALVGTRREHPEYESGGWSTKTLYVAEDVMQRSHVRS